MFPNVGLQDDIGLLKDRWAQEGSTLINLTFSTGGDATVYTVTAGKILYIQALLSAPDGATKDSYQLKTGVAGSDKVEVIYGQATGDLTSITFNPPLSFDSEIYLNEIGDASGTCTLTGWEEDAN